MAGRSVCVPRGGEGPAGSPAARRGGHRSHPGRPQRGGPGPSAPCEGKGAGQEPRARLGFGGPGSGRVGLLLHDR